MKRLAVFASGSGSNFEAIVRACEEQRIPARVTMLVTDHPEAYVVKRALKHGIAVFAFRPKEFESKAHYEQAIIHALGEQVDLICLAGYMRIVGQTLLSQYTGRIINIHPALLPSFAGAHGIRDAFDYGVKVFGVTIHYVDETLDGGKIIRQRGFEYYGNDIEELESKIHQVEHQLYVETINELLTE